MRSVLHPTVALGVLASLVAGHGQVRKIITHNPVATYIAADAYAAADPNSPIRKISEYGPAAPFTGTNITCGVGPSLFALNITYTEFLVP